MQLQLKVAIKVREGEVYRAGGCYTREGTELVNNLCLHSKFSESDPDTFLSLSERIEMQQTGQIQLMSGAESKVHKTVKSSVYEIVPEAYLQNFRSRKKKKKQQP